jgi:hypothetical protein
MGAGFHWLAKPIRLSAYHAARYRMTAVYPTLKRTLIGPAKMSLDQTGPLECALEVRCLRLVL